MHKFLNACLVMTVLVSAFFLYSLEHSTRGLERQNAKLKNNILETRESIKLLGAEGQAAPASPNTDYFPFLRSGVPAVFLVPGPGAYAGLTTDSSQALRRRWDHYHQAADNWAADFPFAGLVRNAEFSKRLRGTRGLNIDKNAIEVNTDDYSTNIEGVYAIGDINTYKNKLKLILCGFHEAALMSHSAYKYINPGVKYTMKYTTVQGVNEF